MLSVSLHTGMGPPCLTSHTDMHVDTCTHSGYAPVHPLLMRDTVGIPLGRAPPLPQNCGLCIAQRPPAQGAKIQPEVAPQATYSAEGPHRSRGGQLIYVSTAPEVPWAPHKPLGSSCPPQVILAQEGRHTRAPRAFTVGKEDRCLHSSPERMCPGGSVCAGTAPERAVPPPAGAWSQHSGEGRVCAWILRDEYISPGEGGT